MAINPKMLDKNSAPMPGGADPMLDETSFDEGEATGEEMPNPFANASDEELMAEAAKRGMKIGPSDEEQAGAASASMGY